MSPAQATISQRHRSEAIRNKRARQRHKRSQERIKRRFIIKHVSEIAKILEAAIRHDPDQALSYAALLADKLERGGEPRASALLRGVMAKAPKKEVIGTASFNDQSRSPRDSDTNLSTVDISNPQMEAFDSLVISRPLQEEIDGIVDSFEARDKLINLGIEYSPRLLLEGPPGTGKTSIARLLAAKLELPLVTTRSDALVSSLLGQTSRNIRDVFDFASRQPCVLFIDEIDALAKNRADSREVGELQRVVIALLENLDAFDSTSLVIGATNHPELLDPAVWRRFGASLKTEVPDFDQRTVMWETNLQMLLVAPRDIKTLSKLSKGLSGSAIRSASIDIARFTVLRDDGRFNLAKAVQRMIRYIPGLASRYMPGDEMAEMRMLRSFSPEVFTLRALAEMYKISTRQVRNNLGESIGQSELGTTASVRSE